MVIFAMTHLQVTLDDTEKRYIAYTCNHEEKE